MKKSVAVGFGIILAVVAAARVEAHGGVDHSKEQAVVDVLTRNAAGFETGDLKALDKLWANEGAVSVFESGHANWGWADYRDNHLAPEIKEMKNVTYKLSDVKAKVDGKTAWATFAYTLGATAGERRVDVKGLGTAVLEKRGSDWKIVHWHTSAPRRAPAPPPTK